MIKVSAKAWHAILSRFGSISRGLAHYSISYHTLWQYLPRLGMLFYILSRLGSILQGSACSCSCSMCLGSICLGLACCSISCHALAVSAKAWHAFLYYHALAVSAKAWHSILYLITPWQNQQKDCKSPSSKNQSYESSS